MNGAPLDNFSGGTSAWSEEDADRFERALRLLSELATTLAHCVDAEAVGEHQDSDLRVEQLRYLEQQQKLQVTDHQEIANILRDAPGRLRQLQGQRP
jgi:hypothetical protein